MSLHLDARQRAMLLEMGVQVWAAGPAHPGAEKSAARAPDAAAGPGPVPALGRAAGDRTAPPDAGHARAATPAQPAHAAPMPAMPAPPGRAAPVAADGAPAAVLQPPQALYPLADPARTPADLGPGWLIVLEGAAGANPLEGEAGRLLENMLRALRLHRHPRVFACTLAPAALADSALQPCADALAQAVAAVRPAVVLVLGRCAAQAVLGCSEPLGRLRAQVHLAGGVPAVVTYDAPYLLRAAPATKAAAWADLCRARALAAGGPAAPPPA